jgi:hypothetical protein
MADTPIEERRFTDREVHEILKKAVERAPSQALVKSEGLSLAELKAIGEEVGIEPARLEDAARAVTQGGSSRTERILCGSMVLNFERKVDREFDPDDTHEILSLIRRTMGQQGEVSEVHGALEWSAKGELGERYVTLSPRDGTTAIHSSSNLSNAAILTYLPTGIIGFFVSVAGLARFAKSGSEIGLILFFAILPILYPILRTIFSKISHSESAKLQQVVDELARLTEESELEPDRQRQSRGG